MWCFIQGCWQHENPLWINLCYRKERKALFLSVSKFQKETQQINSRLLERVCLLRQSITTGKKDGGVLSMLHCFKSIIVNVRENRDNFYDKAQRRLPNIVSFPTIQQSQAPSYKDILQCPHLQNVETSNIKIYEEGCKTSVCIRRCQTI